jgi:hypothetical protein
MVGCDHEWDDRYESRLKRSDLKILESLANAAAPPLHRWMCLALGSHAAESQLGPDEAASTDVQVDLLHQRGAAARMHLQVR